MLALVGGAWTAQNFSIYRHFVRLPGQSSDRPAAAFLSLFLSFHWFIILLAFVSSGLVFLYLSRGFFQGKLTTAGRNRWLLCGLSFAIAYMLALSWPAYSPMVVPGLAVVIALSLDSLESSAVTLASVAAGVVALVIYSHVSYKLIDPFGWMFWQEPPTACASHSSQLPELRGLLLSEPTLQFTERVTSIIETHTKPGDTVLVYPYFPLFYVLSHRSPPTYGFNHFLDVCPDAVCNGDAKLLLQSSPAVIVYMVELTPAMDALESAYRGGRSSGSRNVASAIEKISTGYHLLYSFPTPGYSRQINVYVRS